MDNPLRGFHCKKYSKEDFKIFDPKDFFKNYPYWEEYNPDKEYNKEKFKYNYGKYGKKEYDYFLYEIEDWVTDEKKEYVVSKEILSEKDQKDLSNYCQCAKCKSTGWEKLLSNFVCPCCVGCIKASPSQWNINEARLAKEKKNTNPYLKFLENNF